MVSRDEPPRQGIYGLSNQFLESVENTFSDPQENSGKTELRNNVSFRKARLIFTEVIVV
jgi:hypothetical protein